MELFAQVILPLSLQPLTFMVAEELHAVITVGHCVEVQLGARKLYVGIVYSLHDKRPNYKTIKTISRILYPEILVPHATISLWEWMSEYYMCSLGEVMSAALPPTLKPSAFDQESFEKVLFRPKSEQFVRLNPAVCNRQSLNEAIESVEKRAKARYNAIMCFCKEFDNTEEIFSGEVPIVRLVSQGVKNDIIKKLVDNGIFTIVRRELKISDISHSKFNLNTLSTIQQSVLCQIKESFKTRPTVLLQGITGSGKTELYAHLISEKLIQGDSVMVLLPEISNIKQIAQRMKNIFGDCITVYNSKMSAKQRTEAYLQICSSESGRLIVGVRSAIFLPVKRLKLIIVDEEHDRSFKQDEPAPRYSARDCAVWLAQKDGINTLLGSATPSIESYYNAMCGKYGFATLNERYGNGALPHITISDTLRSAKRGERKAHANKELLDMIHIALNNKRQVILFQNRRGFAPYIECPACGWTAHCPNCSVTMTYHKTENRLRCHHCGHTEPIPQTCPECKKGIPETRGFGTEQVEEDFTALFPNAVIDCLDADSASTGAKYQRIIDDFEQGRTDILVGTQMITKSFDFPNVDVVGILNADNLLNYPDFRSTERTFQSIVQVAGRAGRSNGNGEVIVQTSQPSLALFSQIAHYDYKGMYDCQLAERRIFSYPPFGRLITVILKHRDNNLLQSCSSALAKSLVKRFGEVVNGPYQPVVNRICGIYVMEIMLRIGTGNQAKEIKDSLSQEINTIQSVAGFGRVNIMCNVDPQ